MPGLGRKRKNSGDVTVFRVSDVVDVPLRGIMLRLRVIEGTPDLADFGVGEQLVVRSPAGEERRVRIAAHSVTAGKPSQARLDKTRELDVLLAPGPAGDEPFDIGWTASGPVRDGQ
ncbi:hypothetical protein BH23GEM9_BH23GEM9_06090 [soil metagenome]